MIESECEPTERSRMLVELADVRKKIDPVLSLMLCEAALKTSPKSQNVLGSIRAVLGSISLNGGVEPMVMDSAFGAGPGMTQSGAAAAAASDAAKRANQEAQVRETERVRLEAEQHERLRREAEERERLRIRRELEERDRLRRVAEDAKRLEIKSRGYAGYLKGWLASRSVPPAVLEILDGFQATPMAMVQFLELVRLKGLLSDALWTEARRELEEAVGLADPSSPALAAVRHLGET